MSRAGRSHSWDQKERVGIYLWDLIGTRKCFLLATFYFLLWDFLAAHRFLHEIQLNCAVNKMSVDNLATVIGVNLIRSKVEDPAVIMKGTYGWSCGEGRHRGSNSSYNTSPYVCALIYNLPRLFNWLYCLNCKMAGEVGRAGIVSIFQITSVVKDLLNGYKV